MALDSKRVSVSCKGINSINLLCPFLSEIEAITSNDPKRMLYNHIKRLL